VRTSASVPRIGGSALRTVDSGCDYRFLPSYQDRSRAALSDVGQVS